MNKDFIQKVAEVYVLSELMEEPAQIHGGLLHKMFRVKTRKSQYALKILNPEIINKNGVLQEYITSEEIAESISNLGLDVVFPLRSNNNQIVEKVGNEHIILYPWIEGITLKHEEVTSLHAQKIGKFLGKLHKAYINHQNLKPYTSKFVSLDRWQEIIESLGIVCNNWKFDFLYLAPDLLNLTPQLIKVIEQAKETLVVSHRDLDTKNVLWINEKPYVLDWESVGFVNPEFDLVITALDWSNGVSEEHFKEFIKAYNDIRHIDKNKISNGIYASLNNKCRWLEFNIRRALGVTTQDKDEIEIGNNECIKTIEDIKKTLGMLPTYERCVLEVVGNC